MGFRGSFLFFDLDDTILDFNSGARLAFRAAAEELGLELESDAYEVYRSINLSWWERLEGGEVSAEDLRRGRFRDFLHTIGGPEDLAAAFSELYLGKVSSQAIPYPGAREVLSKLRSSGRDMGMITNGFAQLQPEKLKRAGLEGFFDPLLISEIVGVQKPDAAIFDLARERASRLGLLKPGQYPVMIGDNLNADIRGALNAGWEAIWFDSEGKGRDGILFSGPRVEDWEQLARILNSA